MNYGWNEGPRSTNHRVLTHGLTTSACSQQRHSLDVSRISTSHQGPQLTHSACCQQHPSPSHAPHSTGMFCNDCDVPNSQYLPSSQRCRDVQHFTAFHCGPLWSWHCQDGVARMRQPWCFFRVPHPVHPSHFKTVLSLSEGHRSGWNNSNCPMTYCMLGFSQAEFCSKNLAATISLFWKSPVLKTENVCHVLQPEAMYFLIGRLLMRDINSLLKKLVPFSSISWL